MKLVIMRHGEAEMFADADASRKLTERGQLQAQSAGKCLLEQGFIPDQCWLSPYDRTRQTADAVLSAFADVPRQILNTLTPDNNPSKVIQLLETNSLENLLIISHQPLVGGLVGLLVDASRRNGYPMAPASMALLQADSILTGCCELTWLRHAPHFEVSI